MPNPPGNASVTPSNLLCGTKVRLTALTPDDFPTIARWYQDAEFLRLFDALPAYPKTESALAQWLEDTHKATDAFLFAIRLLDGDELIGYIELDGILWTHQVSGVSIAIGERAMDTRRCNSSSDSPLMSSTCTAYNSQYSATTNASLCCMKSWVFSIRGNTGNTSSVMTDASICICMDSFAMNGNLRDPLLRGELP